MDTDVCLHVFWTVVQNLENWNFKRTVKWETGLLGPESVGNLWRNIFRLCLSSRKKKEEMFAGFTFNWIQRARKRTFKEENIQGNYVLEVCNLYIQNLKEKKKFCGRHYFLVTSKFDIFQQSKFLNKPFTFRHVWSEERKQMMCWRKRKRAYSWPKLISLLPAPTN